MPGTCSRRAHVSGFEQNTFFLVVYVEQGIGVIVIKKFFLHATMGHDLWHMLGCRMAMIRSL